MTLRELLKLNRIPQQLVADALGVSQSNMARYDDLRKRSIEEIITISKATRLSMTDLLGDEVTNELQKGTKRNGRPYYEDIRLLFNDWGGLTWNSVDDNSAYYINYPPFHDCQAYVLYRGDSMSPLINQGDVIALYYIGKMNLIQWGHPYLVSVYNNDSYSSFVYLLYPGEQKKELTLRAINPNYKGDIIVNMDDIVELFLVRGRITRFQM